MPFFVKIILVCLGLYVAALMATLAGEVGFKKRSIHEIRREWKRIGLKSSMVFFVAVIASIVWRILRPEGP